MININLTKNKLAKRNLGLVMIVGFAFMGIIACPSGGGGGGGGSTPTPTTNGDGNGNDGDGNGAPVRCTETDTSLAEVTDPTATPIVATGPNNAGGVTLTWTEPTADGFTGVEITGGTPALASPIMVAAGTQTRVIMGLRLGEMSTFVVKSMYGTNCPMGVNANGATPQGAIALFSLGTQDGDFGFAACQTAIENAANTNLSSRGYTQARFLGSTPDYVYTAIHTDPEALAGEADPSAYTIAAFTDLTGTKAPATTFGSPTATTRTLSNILTLEGTAATTDWTDATRAVIETVTGGALTDAATGNAVWTFTAPGGMNNAGMVIPLSYSADNNCVGATVNTMTVGNVMGANSTNGARANSSTFIATGTGCNNTYHVLCVAR